jgi:3-phytase
MQPSTKPAFIVCIALLALAACRSEDMRRPAPAHAAPVVVAERYVSRDWPDEELDSLATWSAGDGRAWVIASGKRSHRLSVFDADTGARLRTVGERGDGPGQFLRPNGLAVAEGIGAPAQATLLVVERDNRRVQAFALPSFAPAGIIGTPVLRSPYGIWLRTLSGGEIDAYVTDSFMYGERFDLVPPLPELAQRVRVLRLKADGGRVVEAAPARAFGDTSEAGALRIVESLAGDAAHDRLLVADESTAPGRRGSNLREYTLAGRYTGRSLPEGSFDAEAEGVALWQCANGAGYWIAVDQLTPNTRFHLFDRKTLALRGSWRGRTVANTDGIALLPTPTPAFPAGALFAVHQDKALAAFDLRDVARALRLAPGCTD